MSLIDTVLEKKLLAVLLLALLPWVLAGETSFRKLEPRRLRYRPDHSIEVANRAVFTGPGELRLSRPGEIRSSRIPDDLGRYFEPVETPEQARELCELYLWGVVVDSEKQFETIERRYRTHGFDLGPRDADEFRECELLPVEKRKFSGEVKETPLGYRVEFTAFVLPNGMGSSATLARYRFLVSANGQVKPSSPEVYLRGPFLNWQTASSGESTLEEAERFEKAEREKYRKRAELLRAVFDTGSHPLPWYRP